MRVEDENGGNELRNQQNRRGAALTRRGFLGSSLAASFVMGLGMENSWAAENRNGIPYRALGHTGEKVSIIRLGGYHIGMQSDEQENIRIIRTAIDGGINFLDNCWDYNDGASEIRMGKALRDGYRRKAFLMTKIDGRDKKTAAKQIEESLRRLQTDHIDLLQFHEIIRESDPDRIFAPGGGMEAALEAKKSGKIRRIGFTGHKSPDIHLKMLDMGVRPPVQIRYRADAIKRDGCPLQQLREQGASGPGET